MNHASLTTQLPTLHSAIARQGGYFFLLANLFTGLLNFYRNSMPNQTPSQELFSQIVYMFVLCLITQFIDSRLTSTSERRLLRKTQ